ncbi:TetR/AcrR family transcriptional regulator [Modestobacter sp. Leaf380]|uniref:TetR/AcrR family transcriptional regulator n=1 Tax=Modestobacter sp. Leaf380 TaxID=1736356 RepID=UPI0007004FF6|nr:TetR/AcrR family transcriptional regulator [Modestobacter sp. Leaf380]KQS66051.1 hypothetical protein ASG41_11780 [Modestobacter sp. Leaf380]
MPAADRRGALVEAALRVMSRDGLAAGTTRAVVAEAGMSLASFHYAFASRDELMRELVDRVVGRELAAVTPEPGASLTGTLRAAAHGYLAHLEADPGAELFMLELTLHAVRDPSLVPLAARQYTAYTAMAAGLLERAAAAAGTAWRRPVGDLARLLVVLLDGVRTTWLVDRDTAAAAAALDAALEVFTRAHAGAPA